MSNYPLWTVIFITFNLFCLASSQDAPAPFSLERARDPVDVNILTLRCILSISPGGAVPGSMFFLNASNLEGRDDLRVTRTGESIVFLLRQDLEGSYTCGRSIDSNNIQFSLPIQFVGELLLLLLLLEFGIILSE